MILYSPPFDTDIDDHLYYNHSMEFDDLIPHKISVFDDHSISQFIHNIERSSQNLLSSNSSNDLSLKSSKEFHKKVFFIFI